MGGDVAGPASRVRDISAPNEAAEQRVGQSWTSFLTGARIQDRLHEIDHLTNDFQEKEALN